MDEFIKAVCVVLPSGETLWFEAELGPGYAHEVLDKWKAEHPEFANSRANCGFVEITMPFDKFKSIMTASDFRFPPTKD